MMRRPWAPVIVVLVIFASQAAIAQTSSLGARKRGQNAGSPQKLPSREDPKPLRNPVYERYSWISVVPKPPKKFKVHDLITIVVRQQSRFKADSELETKKEWDIRSELEAFFKPTAGGLGAAAFRRGKPTVDYRFSNELTGEGDIKRLDRFTTRITAEIIDVKPNGNLVLQGRGQLTFDDERSEITITGVCRKVDVTPDNTVLSTQLGQLDIKVDNQGALRSASRRGWIPVFLDWLRPI